MKNFTSVNDVSNLSELVKKAQEMKARPQAFNPLGQGKVLTLLFFNPSLRTRLSTQRAGFNLGMQVISMNADQGWKLEFEDQVVMNGDKAEHIREAAAVVSQYADIIGIRTFPSLTDREKDYADVVINKFIEFASVPIISLESAIRHPLQSLADLLTIEEFKKRDQPKIVLSWAPHPRALPQAVANSFAEWVQAAGYDLTITHPKGYELARTFAVKAKITHHQEEAFAGADFIYTKNWSTFQPYGQALPIQEDWTITPEKMALTNQAFFMHCLPVRRNVVVTDQVLDSAQSIVIAQANNRTYAAQAVIAELLNNKEP
ncbi:MAG: N-acetylornithine carbamoyltransferase [Saprospiraceae bacterium]|nr:MAG: N-acetylornithine carbamoyltransferase [Saprospiraceae bacterium]